MALHRYAHKKSGGFNEYTYVDARRNEVMVHRAVDSGTVLKVYAYADASFLVPAAGDSFKIDEQNYSTTPAERKLRWRRKQNQLFVHASNPKVAYDWLVTSGRFQSGGEDPFER